MTHLGGGLAPPWNLLNVLEKLTGLVLVYGDGLPRNESCSSCCSRAKHFSESGSEVV